MDPISRGVERQRSLDDVSDKTKPSELVEIVERVQCRAVTMPDSIDPANKVLFYFIDFNFVSRYNSSPGHQVYNFKWSHLL